MMVSYLLLLFTSDYTLRVSLSYTTAAVLGSPASMRTRARPHRLRICVEVPSWKQYVLLFLFFSRVLASLRPPALYSLSQSVSL